MAFDLLLLFADLLVFDFWQLVEVFRLACGRARLDFNNALLCLFLRGFFSLGLGPPQRKSVAQEEAEVIELGFDGRGELVPLGRLGGRVELGEAFLRFVGGCHEFWSQFI